jgi:hypothetical protein
MNSLTYMVCLAALVGPAVSSPVSRDQAASSSPRAAVKLEIVSAERATRWSLAGTDLTATEPDDVVLVVNISGISIEDFQNFQTSAKEKIFFSAGDARYEPSLLSSGAWKEPDGSVTEERLILVVVPKGTRAFTLHFVEFPPVRFTTAEAIVPQLPR